ncbi:MAG: hypothetical protein B1H02_01885 [Candidatus Latescibacteria bacterium 4484_107]|nr:MAG: hypothetical protein B1H02_01885 [Candidatus Latescibacteria bacterium 4484_107]
MNFQKFQKSAHRKDAEGAKDFKTCALSFFAFFAPLRWAFLFPVLLSGTLWLGGCAGTREPVPEFVENTEDVRVRVLFDPFAGREAGKVPVRFTAFPKGLRTAVCFGGDVKGEEAWELAGLLQQYGWRGTLFFPCKMEGKAAAAVADGILQVEARGMEVGCRTSFGRMEDVTRCASEGKTFWDAFLTRPVVSFGGVEDIAPGDAVTLGERGYLSVCSADGVMALGTSRKERFVLPCPHDGHADMARRWIAVREQEGGLFYVWKRLCASNADPLPWEELESLLAEYGRMEDAWYCTQGEWAAYVLMRDTSRIVRLEGEENELCIEIKPGRSVPETWCSALTVELKTSPESVVMVLVEDRPVAFETQGERVLFEVEMVR